MRRALAAGVVLLVAGCAHYYGVRTYEADAPAAYLQAVKSHSSTGKYFEPLTPRFQAGVTFETPEFKAVLRREIARMRSRPVDAVDVDPRPSVVVFIDSPHSKEEDITRRDRTFWVGVEAGGTRWEAGSVEEMDTQLPTAQHLFPYVNQFGRAYRLFLPESVVLKRGESVVVVSGAPGELRLPFE